MKVTINEVAKLADVSKSTVSRVINATKPVGKEKRERVIRAINELEFKPNSLARGLVHKRTGLVGVIIPDITNPFFAELVRGIEQAIRNEKYNMVLCNTSHRFQKEMEYLEMMRDKHVDGIIFMTSKVTEDHRKFFRKSQLPVTFINRRADDLHASSVDIDNYQAAFDMTHFFLQRGHRRVAIIRAPLTDRTSGFDRFRGYQDAMRQFGIEPDSTLIMRSPFKISNAYHAVNQFLDKNPPVTAIFATSDLMAIGAIKCLQERGIKVPDEVEVAGFDDILMASFYHPSITTVHQPIEKMGNQATYTLIRLIKGEQTAIGNQILPYEIIHRQSTGVKNIQR